MRWRRPDWTRESIRSDLAAGLTTAVVLIPQGMGYAMLAGLPPIYGLYSAMLPLIGYALLGTSRQLAVGPVAMDSLLVAAGVGAIAEIGSDAFIAYAIVLAGMVGLIQLAMGLGRLGFLVNFLSAQGA
ncbi:MAG: SulP family inorganic anion transporter [Myxococcota bacterium]